MNVTGIKVHIRERRPDDSVNEFIWSHDPDVVALDPPAGRPADRQQLSIDTIGGEHIGSCALYGWTPTEVQLGIRIGNSDFWGQGYGTEVIGLLVDHCFTHTNVSRVWLKVLPGNIRAIKCYTRCGFGRVGKLALDGYDFIVMERKR